MNNNTVQFYILKIGFQYLPLTVNPKPIEKDFSLSHFSADTAMKNLVRTALGKIEAVTCIRFKEYPMGQAPGHFVRIISSDEGLVVFFTVTLATQSADIPL